MYVANPYYAGHYNTAYVLDNILQSGTMFSKTTNFEHISFLTATYVLVFMFWLGHIRPHKVNYLFLIQPSFKNWPGDQGFILIFILKLQLQFTV